MTTIHQESERSSHEANVDPRIERSRSRLIEAATDLLVEAGPQAVTVDAVAERSGVAKSTLYRHWDSIESLLVDTFRCAIPAAVPIEPAATFEESLRQQVLGIAHTLADPKWLRILPSFLALRERYPEIKQLTEKDRSEKATSIEAVLELGVAEGRIPDGLDPQLVANTLAGPMVLCSLTGDATRLEEVGLYALERFLAGYALAGENGDHT